MEEETQISAGSPLGELLAEDLSPMGLEELAARIGALENEIERCRATIESKKSSHSDAEAIFRNKRCQPIKLSNFLLNRLTRRHGQPAFATLWSMPDGWSGQCRASASRLLHHKSSAFGSWFRPSCDGIMWYSG